MTNEMDELIRKVLDGNASEEEIRVLMRWMREDERRREYFIGLKKVWNMMNGPKLSSERKSVELERFISYMQQTSLKRKEPVQPRVIRLWYRYAAVNIDSVIGFMCLFVAGTRGRPNSCKNRYRD